MPPGSIAPGSNSQTPVVSIERDKKEAKAKQTIQPRFTHSRFQEGALGNTYSISIVPGGLLVTS